MSRHRLVGALALLLVLAAAPVPSAAVGPATPFALWEVQEAELDNLGQPRVNLIVKSFSVGMDPVRYLNTARANGLAVVVYFMDTVDYAAGTIHTSRIKPWVDKVKTHPALYGYLSVKEPSWSGISLTEMRTLYKAYKAADPNHRVIALLGDVPHFGSSANPWNTGVANMLWLDWYPVTYSRGYIGTASTWFPKVRAHMERTTPNTPVWLMVQGHGYRPGDRRTPTPAELERQVRDAFRYLKASGILFHTWNNARYDSDLRRNATLWGAARTIVAKVRAGTF